MSLLGAFDIGSTGLTAQSMRMNTTASNIANVESVSGPDGRPYRARQVEFSSVYKAGQPGSGVEVSKIIESNAPMRIEYRPGHPKANAAGYVEMPNVNPVEEMVNMISASRSYQMNVEAMNVSRQLMLKTLDLGK
jgi:flagellar basal-body rod protein FlgC